LWSWVKVKAYDRDVVGCVGRLFNVPVICNGSNSVTCALILLNGRVDFVNDWYIPSARLFIFCSRIFHR